MRREDRGLQRKISAHYKILKVPTMEQEYGISGINDTFNERLQQEQQQEASITMSFIRSRRQKGKSSSDNEYREQLPPCQDSVNGIKLFFTFNGNKLVYTVNVFKLLLLALTTAMFFILEFRHIVHDYIFFVPNGTRIRTTRSTTTTDRITMIDKKTPIKVTNSNHNSDDLSFATVTESRVVVSTTNAFTPFPNSKTTTTSSRTTTSAPSTISAQPVIVVQYKHWIDLERFVGGIWNHNLFCDTIDDLVHQYYTNSSTTTTDISIIPIPTIHISFELSCQDIFNQSREGTGNYIQLIYMMRLSMQYITNANTRLNITCTDISKKEVQTSYVLPWFTGVWYSPHYYNIRRNVNNTKNPKVANSSSNITIAPMWLQGHRNPSSLQLLNSNNQSNQRLTLRRSMYCGSYHMQPTALMVKEMKYDIRRMVIALTIGGMNNRYLLQQLNVTFNRAQTVFPHWTKIRNFLQGEIYSNYTTYGGNMEESLPRKVQYLLPGNQQERIDGRTTDILPLLDSALLMNDIDDVIVHFRCGDLLSTNLTSYGFLSFHGYSQHINITTTKTIGIVTQPFGLADPGTNNSTVNQQQQRTLDSGNNVVAQRCRTLVFAFVDYLQDHYPSTAITIRNNVSDSIAVTYVRMVLAKQVIGSMSTFSVFPIIGTFGTGYYLSPQNYEPSIWMNHRRYPITKAFEELNNSGDNNFILFHDNNTLVGPQTRMLWDQYGEETVLKWFRTGERDSNIQ